MRSLIDFFNHGMLPFTGRAEPLERLTAFWQGTADAPGLRVALLTGEAGVGKSRLVEEFIPRVAASGGAVIHARLYPGAALSIAGLLLEAIRHSNVGRTLLKKIPGESIGGVIAAIQRLTRLRPTLLIIEDLHLLGEEARGDFVAILDAISDEPISLLSLARPIELPMRGALERYLVEEIDLQGLDRQQLEILWRELFGAPPRPEILEIVEEVTLGHPLALRSALRGALKEGALVQDGSEQWGVGFPPGAFREILLRNVQILSEGMVAHLNDREKRLAGELAALGEVFGREGATEVIENAEREIEILTFKGILFPTTTPAAPLPGQSSTFPLLAFTHTLLHRHFLHHGTTDPSRLVTVIASHRPLYSVLPFQVLAETASAVDPGCCDITGAIDRALDVAYWLDSTSDWKMAPDVLGAADALENRGHGEWSREKHMEMRARIISCRLRLLRRENHLPSYRELVDELVSLTEEPANDLEAQLRISALAYLFKQVRRDDPDRGQRLIEEADHLVSTFPKAELSAEYVSFLQMMATVNASEDETMIIARGSERRLQHLLAREDATEEFRHLALREVAPLFLWMFHSPEDLERRLAMIQELERAVGQDDLIFATRQAAFYDGIGRGRESIAIIDRILPLLRERGLLRQVHQVLMVRLYALTWFGITLEEVEQLLRRVSSDAPAEMREWLAKRSSLRLVRIGLQRGDARWTRHMIDEFLGGSLEEVETAERIILATAEGNLQATLKELLETGIAKDDVDELIRAAVEDGISSERVIDEAVKILGAPIMTRGSIGTIYATIDLAESEGPRQRSARLDSAIVDSLRRALEWLSVRELHGYMSEAIRRGREYLDKKEIDRCEQRRLDIIRREEATAAPPEAKLKVSMMGTVQIQHPSAEPTRVRGARLRGMLGLLVADRMLERPLSYREFCRIAADGEIDQEKARKVMNMGVLRLRELIGTDAVLTDQGTPRLNREKVQVDLLDANELLKRAAEAIREGSLVRAHTSLLGVLELTCGEVPFPTLYDTFFEAAREEFEHTLRRVVIELSRNLLDEDDPVSAEEILRRSFDAMPGDEEIADLLRETLVSLGKRMEAERIRMRVVEDSPASRSSAAPS